MEKEKDDWRCVIFFFQVEEGGFGSRVRWGSKMILRLWICEDGVGKALLVERLKLLVAVGQMIKR